MSEEEFAFKLGILAARKYKRGDYQGAIDAFSKSLSLKEDWKFYHGLGWSLFNAHQYPEAIDAFCKSLAIKEDWNSYLGFGWSLFNTNQYPEAIDAFSKSLLLKEDWKSYRGLGGALLKKEKYPEAIDAFHKSFELMDSSFNEKVLSIYPALANAYDQVGNLNSSIRSWEKFFQCSEYISLIDPFLDNGGIYEEVVVEQLEEYKSTCNGYGFDFHPSFKENDDSILESWKYLMYLHIPKCGGTSFERPFHLIKSNLVELNRKYISLKGNHHYMNTCKKLKSGSEVEALIRLMNQDSCKGLRSIFVTFHGAAWSELPRHTSTVINAFPRIITTLRDPRERLLSMIKMDAKRHKSLEELLAHINKNVHEYDNAITRYIYDNGLVGDSRAKIDKDSEESRLVDDIDFLDISDSYTISKVKSSFLSASLLPNIIQYSRLRDSRDQGIRDSTCRISANEIQDIFTQCIDKGFLEKDELINFDFLKRKTIKRLNFPPLDNNNTCMIHPYTFILGKDLKAQGSIIPTKNFLRDPLDVLEKLSF